MKFIFSIIFSFFLISCQTENKNFISSFDFDKVNSSGSSSSSKNYQENSQASNSTSNNSNSENNQESSEASNSTSNNSSSNSGYSY